MCHSCEKAPSRILICRSFRQGGAVRSNVASLGALAYRPSYETSLFHGRVGRARAAHGEIVCAARCKGLCDNASADRATDSEKSTKTSAFEKALWTNRPILTSRRGNLSPRGYPLPLRLVVTNLFNMVVPRSNNIAAENIPASDVDLGFLDASPSLELRAQVMESLGCERGTRLYLLDGVVVDLGGRAELLSPNLVELSTAEGQLLLEAPEESLIQRVLMSVYPQEDQDQKKAALLLMVQALAGNLPARLERS